MAEIHLRRKIRLVERVCALSTLLHFIYSIS